MTEIFPKIDIRYQTVDPGNLREHQEGKMPDKKTHKNLH